MKNLTLNDICKMIVARRMRDQGVSVAEIARQAKASESTVQRWLKDTGYAPSRGAQR